MENTSEKSKMLSGALYRPQDANLAAERREARILTERFNRAEASDLAGRGAALAALFGALGEGCLVEPPFACDYGYNIRLGQRSFVNFGCVFLDCAPIEIGTDLQMGPGVHLYTPLHPLDPAERLTGLESALPIRIGDNVWIGGGAIVLPGVTIGDGAVVGAGAVVTRDVAPMTLALGNPARPVRRLDGA